MIALRVRRVALKAFSKFVDTAEALQSATALVEGRLSSGMKKFLKKNIVSKELTDTLAVADAKLGGAIKEKLSIPCVWDEGVMQLMRGLRSQIEGLLTGTTGPELRSMQIGLAHSLSRYKLKFSPDKVDTMIVQAIGLLDDLDKELNTYAMRLKEWCVHPRAHARTRPLPPERGRPFAPLFSRARAGTGGTFRSWPRSCPTI